MRQIVVVSLIVLAICGCGKVIGDNPCKPGCKPDNTPFVCRDGVEVPGRRISDHSVIDCWGGRAVTTQCDHVAGSGACLGKGMQLSANYYFTCLRDEAGSVWCWGYGSSGQLGNGKDVDRSAYPVRAQLPAPATDISVGYGHVCAVVDNGAVFCWGDDEAGQSSGSGPLKLEPGTFISKPAPVKGVIARSIVAGLGHTCAMTDAGAVSCWGANTLEQCGVAKPDFTKPVTPAGLEHIVVKSIQTVRDHTCAVASDGAVWCWGSNLYLPSYNAVDCSNISATSLPCESGQLGVPGKVSLPRRLLPPESVVPQDGVIGMGVRATYVLDPNNEDILAWGVGDHQLPAMPAGDACSTTAKPCASSPTLTAVKIPLPRAELLARSDGSDECALVLAGTGETEWECWGEQSCGELGRGTNELAKAVLPTPNVATVLEHIETPPGALALGAFARGSDHGCFIDGNYDVWCFGNEYLLGTGIILPDSEIKKNDDIGCPDPQPTPVKVWK